MPDVGPDTLAAHGGLEFLDHTDEGRCMSQRAIKNHRVVSCWTTCRLTFGTFVVGSFKGRRRWRKTLLELDPAMQLSKFAAHGVDG